MSHPSLILRTEHVVESREGSSGASRGTAGPPVAISIVSNSCLLCEGLAILLLEHIDVWVVGCYAGTAAVEPPCVCPPEHVVLLDSGVGRDAALGWVHYWRGQPAPVPVVVMELVNDIELIIECIEAGASGYTLQGASVADVAVAIDQARHGLAHCSPEITARLFDRLAALRAAQAEPPQLDVPLTARELEVLRWVSLGYSNQAIASTLVIEVRTVKHHVHNILEKLKLRQRGEAAQMALERGWLHREH